MPYDLKIAKSSVRVEYLKKRRAVPKDKKAEFEKKICENIINSASYKYYDTLLLYAALEDEPDLSYLAETAIKDGKRIAYPRCIPESRNMTFRYVTDLSELSVSTYGIKEPGVDAPVFENSDSACCVCFIPAVAVDKHGYRIGYGGGYYDRFLSGFKGTLAAVTFSLLITEKVPHGKYDLKADFTVTEGGILTVVKN